MKAQFGHPNSLRIWGPAGSGKTRAVIEILQRHVEDGDFRLGEGVIVSFTRAAAHDIARRVNPEGEPGRYHCTLHALCKRYYGFDSEFADGKLKDFFGERHIAYKGGAAGDPEEWMATADAERTEGSLLVSFWSLCRNRMVSLLEGKALWQPEPEVAHWWAEDRMERLYAEYQSWKAEHGYVDFTDMLEYAAANPPSAWWPFFVLDEAQDSTPLQWSVIQNFAACAEVAYLAGDDDQAIYSWAGATPVEFLGAKVAADDILRVNHRSGGVLVDAAQKFIRRNRVRRDKDMAAAREGGEVVTLAIGELPVLDPSVTTFAMARAHYLNVPLMEELETSGFPFVDRRDKYGVSGKASSAYQRFLRLSRNQAVTLDEVRLLFDGIASSGPWLARGTKTRLIKMDSEQRANTYVRLADLGYYGANEELVTAVRGGDVSVLTRIDQGRLGYLREVEKRYGPEMLDVRKAGEICQVGSIHAFKGLECDTTVWHSGWPYRAAREAMYDPEPERRVGYVAGTRAKERLVHYNAGATPFATWQGLL